MLPGYSVLIADTRTGTIYDDLPMSDFSWTDSIDWGRPGNMTITCPLLGEVGVSERDARTKAESVASAPWKTTLILVRGSTPLWAGPVATHVGDEQTVQFGCVSIQQILDARLVIAAGYLDDPNNAAADVTFTVDAGGVAAGLLQLAVTGIGRELPLFIPSPATVLSPTRTYPSVDLASTADRLKALTEEDGGPDIRFLPTLNTQQTQLTWVTDIGTPHVGDPLAPWVWDYKVETISLSVDSDATAMATREYVVGDGQDRDRIIGIAADTTGVAAGFPVLERVSRDNAANKSAVVVQALADAALLANLAAATAWTVGVDPEMFPEIGTWRIGDNGLLSLQGHPWVPDGEYLRRITGVTHTPGNAALETMAPLPRS